MSANYSFGRVTKDNSFSTLEITQPQSLGNIIINQILQGTTTTTTATTTTSIVDEQINTSTNNNDTTGCTIVNSCLSVLNDAQVPIFDVDAKSSTPQITLNANTILNGDLNGITSFELSQLKTLDQTIISPVQWTYLGTQDQSISTGSSPTFSNLTLSGNLTLGPMSVLAGLTQDTLTQLQNIGSTTIGSTQWLIVGGLDQSLGTTDNVTFNNLSVNGDLFVAGVTTTVNSGTIEVADSILELAHGNVSDVLDCGFYGVYNDINLNSTRYRGVVFDVSAGEWVFYTSGDTKPGTTLSGTYTLANITCGLVNGEDVNAMKAAINTNTNSLINQAANIASNTSSIQTNATNISTNTTNISTNTTDIATNASNISTNTTSIAQNATDIQTNTTNISQNTANIIQNTTDISTNTTAITGLDSRVTVVEGKSALGYEFDQNLRTTDNPIFNILNLTGLTFPTWSVDQALDTSSRPTFNGLDTNSYIEVHTALLDPSENRFWQNNTYVYITPEEALNRCRIGAWNSTLNNGAGGSTELVINESTYFTGDGKVGIGTNTPSTALDVVGDITVSGSVAGLTPNIQSQLQNIGTTVIPATAWTHMSTLDQGLTTSSDVQFNNLDLTGNLNVSGTMTTVNSSVVQVADSMLELAYGNTSNTLDIGIYGNYSLDNGVTPLFCGLVCESTTKDWILYKNGTTQPGTQLSGSYEWANLHCGAVQSADSLLYLDYANTVDTHLVGWYQEYGVSGMTYYRGAVYDPSTQQFVLFDQTTTQPVSTGGLGSHTWMDLKCGLINGYDMQTDVIDVIQSNTTAINTNTTAISQNTTDIANHSNRLTTIEGKSALAYEFNQNLRTSDSPTFTNITITGQILSLTGSEHQFKDNNTYFYINTEEAQNRVRIGAFYRDTSQNPPVESGKDLLINGDAVSIVNGKVGIRNGNPAYDLHVNGFTVVTNDITSSSGNITASIGDITVGSGYLYGSSNSRFLHLYADSVNTLAAPFLKLWYDEPQPGQFVSYTDIYTQNFRLFNRAGTVKHIIVDDNLVHMGDDVDLTPYGVVQITRELNPSTNLHHLSFIRNTAAISGLGYYPNTSKFYITNREPAKMVKQALFLETGLDAQNQEELRVGLNTETPQYTFDCIGNGSFTENIYASNISTSKITPTVSLNYGLSYANAPNGVLMNRLGNTLFLSGKFTCQTSIGNQSYFSFSIDGLPYALQPDNAFGHVTGYINITGSPVVFSGFVTTLVNSVNGVQFHLLASTTIGININFDIHVSCQAYLDSQYF